MDNGSYFSGFIGITEISLLYLSFIPCITEIFVLKVNRIKLTLIFSFTLREHTTYMFLQHGNPISWDL